MLSEATVPAALHPSPRLYPCQAEADKESTRWEPELAEELRAKVAAISKGVANVADTVRSGAKAVAETVRSGQGGAA